MKKNASMNKHTFIVPIILVAFLFFLVITAYVLHPTRYIKCSTSALTVQKTYLKNGEAVVENVKIPKGTKVKVHEKKETSSIISYDHYKYKVKNTHLVKTLDDAIQTDYVYCRRLVNLQNEKGGKLSKVVVKKGEKVKVLSVDKEDWNQNTGQVNWYKVSKNKKTYYLNGVYAESTKNAALKNYGNNIPYSTYWDKYYEDGYAKDAYISQIDYKPNKKAVYENNQMPKNVKAIHVSMNNFVHNQEYIESLNNINTIIVETKNDEGSILYSSDVCKNYLSDSNRAIKNAEVSKDELKKIMA